MKRRLACLIVCASFGAASAEEAERDTAKSAFDVAFGVAALTDYVDDGATQTEGGPAIQGFVEPSLGILYGRLWASNVSFAAVEDVEIELGVGIRPELGPFELDAGYSYGFYAGGIDDPSHELHFALSTEILERLELEGELAWEPLEGAWSAEAGAAIALLEDVELSGAIAYVRPGDPAEVAFTAWQAGLGWTFLPGVTVGVHYHGSSLSDADCVTNGNASGACGHRFLGSLSLETSLSELRQAGSAD